MLKWLRKKKKDNKGFSLVELIVVVAIMAILVGLVAPQYLKYVEKSKKSADANNLDEMVKAVQIYAADDTLDANEGLPAGLYKIQLGLSGSRFTKVGTGTTIAAVTQKIEEIIPDFTDTKLKSSKWGRSDIEAEITINADGGTTVKYRPGSLAEMMRKEDADKK